MAAPWRFFAVIHPDSPRREAWFKLLGRDWVEVESNESLDAVASDGNTCRFYKVKVDSLTPEELGRFYDLFSRLWGLPTFEVVMEVWGDHGIPIEARDVRIRPGLDAPILV